MSTEDLKIALQKRTLTGKKAKKLVDDGMVLGNVYGKGHDSVAVMAPRRELAKVVEIAGKNHPISLDIEGEAQLALVSDIERDNITQEMHHVSFHIVKRGEKVHAEVPIHQTGEAPALRTGKIIITLLDFVEVEADPTKLPDHFDIDVSSLIEVGDTVHVSDLKVSADVEIQNEADSPIAKVDIPRSQVEDETEDEEAEGEGDESAADVPSEHGEAAEASEGKE